MATYGILPTGFYAKPLQTINDEIDAALQAILGSSAGTDADGKIPLSSKAGQLKSLIVDREAALWDLVEAAVASFNPNQNFGATQDAVAAITGAIRRGEQFSTVTATCTGTPLTKLLAGRAAKVTSTGSRFLTLADATIVAISAWIANHVYALNDRVTNASRVYICITAGQAASSGGPTTTAADITDNVAHWKYLGDGTGDVDVAFQSQEIGAIGALAGTLVNIDTPVDGWKNVQNLLDAQLGNEVETDPAFRLRRDQELSAAGNTTPDAIRANILSVNEGSSDPSHQPPIACKVFYNDTDTTDVNGLPPHSVEVLVQGGTTADIAQAIWDSIGAGTVTYGQRSDPVVDSEGNAQTVFWTRPTEAQIWLNATGKYDASAWPTGSDALVAQSIISALLTYTINPVIGLDVRTSPLIGAILRGPSQTDDSGTAVIPADPASAIVPGLLEMDPLYIGTSNPATTSTTIQISLRQIAVFDVTRCTITATTETP